MTTELAADYVIEDQPLTCARLGGRFRFAPVRLETLMALSDLSPLSYFKELQLLPRVVFTIGGAFFFGGLFIKDWRVLLFGVGLVFISVGYNFLFDLYFNDPVPPYVTRFSWLSLFQGLLALAVGAFALYIVVYNYRHGFLPKFLQPIPR